MRRCGCVFRPPRTGAPRSGCARRTDRSCRCASCRPGRPTPRRTSSTRRSPSRSTSRPARWPGRCWSGWPTTTTCSRWPCTTSSATAGRWTSCSRDLFALYEARRGGRPPGFAELPVQYGDYAIRQRRGAVRPADGDLAYWKRQLAGLPPLDLATDRPRPAEQTYGGAAHELPPRPDPDAVRATTSPGGATRPLYMTLLAAFQVLLGRYAGAATTSPSAPRSPGRPAAGAGARRRHVRQHAAAARRPVRRPDLRRAARPGPRGTGSTPTTTRNCRSSGWSNELDLPRDVTPLAAVPGAVRAAELRARGAARRARRELAVEWLRRCSRGRPASTSSCTSAEDRRGTGRAVRLQHRPVRTRDRRPARGALHGPAARGCWPTPDACVDDAELLGARGAAPSCMTGCNDTAAEFPVGDDPARARSRRRPRAAPDAVAVTFEGARPDLPRAERARPTGSRTACAGSASARRRWSPSAPSGRWSWSSRCSACSRPAPRTCRWTRSTRPTGSPSCSPTRRRRSCSPRSSLRGLLPRHVRDGARRSTTSADVAGAARHGPGRAPGRATSRTSSTPPARPGGPRACPTPTAASSTGSTGCSGRYRLGADDVGAAEDPGQLRRVGVGVLLAAAAPGARLVLAAARRAQGRRRTCAT